MMDMNLFGSLGASVQATFALTNEQVSQLSSLSFYGMFFGGLLGGWMADKIGRKKALLYNVLIFSLASLGNALIDNYFIFAFCRFMTGFGIIGMNIIAMVYIAEMMPAHSRGKYQGQMAALGSLGIPFGIILAAIVVPRSPEAWRIMFLIGVVTPTVPILFAMQGPVAGNGMFNVMGMNAIFYLIPAIICLLWGSKTAQKSLEEIEAEARK
ncbi:MAG: MFS transporter [Peptococcaceae bacterium]|nr:MFS transporter [Peptococcaceae bacterium]